MANTDPRTADEILRELYNNDDATSIDEIFRQVYGSGSNNTIMCGPNCKYTTVQAAVDAAAVRYATTGTTQYVHDYTGDAYVPAVGVKVARVSELYNPANPVILASSGGHATTIKAAVALAGQNRPIVVRPDHIVAASGGDFTTLTACLADEGVTTGHIILIRDGTYTTAASSTLSINKEVQIVGESREGTILEGAAVDSLLDFTSASAIANITIDFSLTAGMTLTGLTLYAYNASVLCGGPLTDGSFGTGFNVELDKCRFASLTCGVVESLYGSVNSYALTDSILETVADVTGMANPSVQNWGQNAVIRATRTVFRSVPMDGAADAMEIVKFSQSGTLGLFDECAFIGDWSGCPSATSGGCGVSVTDEGDVTLLNCVFDLKPSSTEAIQYHLKRTAGTLRNVNSTTLNGEALVTSGTISPAFVIDTASSIQ